MAEGSGGNGKRCEVEVRFRTDHAQDKKGDEPAMAAAGLKR